MEQREPPDCPPSPATGGWWSTDRVLALANVVLAVLGLTTIIFGLATIRSSGAMARTATDQAEASGRLAEAASAQNLAGVRPLLVEVPKGLFGAAEQVGKGPAMPRRSHSH